MPNCEQCSKPYHHCGSCGTGHDPDQFFCSSECETKYSEQYKITEIGKVIQELFKQHVPYEKQRELVDIMYNLHGEVDYLMLFEQVKYACFTAPKPPKTK